DVSATEQHRPRRVPDAEVGQRAGADPVERPLAAPGPQVEGVHPQRPLLVRERSEAPLRAQVAGDQAAADRDSQRGDGERDARQHQRSAPGTGRLAGGDEPEDRSGRRQPPSEPLAEGLLHAPERTAGARRTPRRRWRAYHGVMEAGGSGPERAGERPAPTSYLLIGPPDLLHDLWLDFEEVGWAVSVMRWQAVVTPPPADAGAPPPRR